MLSLVSSEALLRWLLVLALLAFGAFTTSRWIIPSILRALVSNLRFRSISFRSIRGLFIKRGGNTIQLDRIGISFHSPTDASARHIHVQIEGLVVKVSNMHDEAQTEYNSHSKKEDHHPFSVARLAIAPTLTMIAELLPSGILWAFDAIMRPILGRCFVAAARLFIRLLPSLSQIIDIELDRCTVVFEDLDDAYMTISGVTFATKANFVQLGYSKERSNDEDKTDEEPVEEQKSSKLSAGWRARFSDSSKRVWGRAWGVTEGSTSMTLRVGEIVLSDEPYLNSRFRSRTTSFSTLFPSSAPPTPTVAKSFLSVSRDNVSTESLEPGIALAMTSPAVLKVALKFTPNSLESKSLVTSVDIPTLLVSSRAMQSFISKLEQLRLPIPVEPLPPTPHIIVTPPTSSPGLSIGLITTLKMKTRQIRNKVASMDQSLTDPQPEKPLHRQKPVRKRKHVRLETNMIRILQSAEIRVFSFSIEHELSGLAKSLRCVTHSCFIKLKQTNPEDDEMQRRWLGNSPLVPSLKLDADALSLSFGFSNLSIERVSGSHGNPETTSLLLVGESGVDFVATQWPRPLLYPASSLGDDPNAAVLLCQTRIRRVRVSEKLDQLNQTLSMLQSKHTSPSPSSTQRTRLHSGMMPRVVADLALTDIKLRFLHEDPINPAAAERFVLEVGTDHLTANINSHFIERSFQPRTHTSVIQNVAPTTDKIPLKLVYDGTVHVATCTARLKIIVDDELKHDYLDDDSVIDSENSHLDVDLPTPMSSASSDSYPSGPIYEIVQAEPLECAIRGQALAPEDNEGRHFFTSLSFLTELKMRMEEVIVDLRDLRAATPLQRLFATLNRPASQSAEKSLVMSLPKGISLYAWVGSLRMAIADVDLNPDIASNASIARGIGFSSSLIMEYCHLIAPLHTPVERQDKAVFAVPIPLVREELELPADIISQASSFAIESGKNDGTSALMRLALLHGRMWSLVRSETYTADFPTLENNRSSIGGKPRLDSRIIADFPNFSIRGFLTAKKSLTSGEFIDRINLSMEARRVFFRFELQHAYGILLAMGRFRKFRTVVRPPSGRSPKSVSTPNVQLRVDDIHVMAALPTDQLLYLRATIVVAEHTSLQSWVRGHDILAWVPSAQPLLRGRWEELCRIREWIITHKIPVVQSSTSEIHVDVKIDAARLRIPYKYALNHLIQGFSLAAKAVHHTNRQISTGKYQAMGLPMPEDAKILPSVNVNTTFLSIEAADDPFESQINLNIRAGLDEQRARLERSLAFEAKVAAIKSNAAAKEPSTHRSAFDWQFDSRHSVDADDAWKRLQLFASQSWARKVIAAVTEQERKEDTYLRPLHSNTKHVPLWSVIDVFRTRKRVPLLRFCIRGIDLQLSSPQFGRDDGLRSFMSDLGGLPTHTAFSLLVPLHVKWVAGSIRASIRDYPLPIVNIPEARGGSPAWSFETDLVVAEEMGPPSSVVFITCQIAPSHESSPGLVIAVPKTVMPIKTYAEPSIKIAANGVSDFCWGVSFTPALADIMRVLDAVTSPSRDPSPPPGFWDKLRLSWHWKLNASFIDPVHIHLKGSRDPYPLTGDATGFVLEWKGEPLLTVGKSKADKELIQLSSDRMYLAIPDLKRFETWSPTNSAIRGSTSLNSFDKVTRMRHGRHRKVVAKFKGGVRMGTGFVFERETSSQLDSSSQTTQTRLFNSKPHYEVQLNARPGPEDQPMADSYEGFRSQHIHLSVSLLSTKDASAKSSDEDNIFHLSPSVFSHFWSWWSLFNHSLALPIRQGKLFPGGKAPSPKFSRHLATLKYRISIAPLLLSHIYQESSRTSWKRGITTFVGIKLMTDGFHADLHQREQVLTEYDTNTKRSKQITHKRFHSAEVVLIGSELRAVRACFSEPHKALFSADPNFDEVDSSPLPEAEPEALTSDWIDLDDFAEVDWAPSDSTPRIWVIPCGFCPRFTYIKRLPSSADHRISQSSRFGTEDTHVCLQGMEDSVQIIQMKLVQARLDVLRSELAESKANGFYKSGRPSGAAYDNGTEDRKRESDLEKRIGLLEEHIAQLMASHERDEETRRHSTGPSSSTGPGHPSFYMTLDDSVRSELWDAFHNVYQIHCPTVVLSNTTRDILLNYYHASRERRGFEYRMATRAVKFIREQTATVKPLERPATAKKAKKAATRVPGKALRRILTTDVSPNLSKRPSHHRAFHNSADIGKPPDPRNGLSDDVVVRNGHCMLLLKPQIALRSEQHASSNLIAVANTVSLNNFAIMDPQHWDDPVHGVVMQRNYIKLNQFQVFAPNQSRSTDVFEPAISVPLEVLVDYRCEHSGFTRLLPQTDASVQYDKFNKLRLHSDFASVSSTNHVSDLNEHLRTHSDRVSINIPRLSIQANSGNFAAIYDVISNLLLYHDPAQKHRSEALEKFIYLYDFRDRHTASKVVSRLQFRIRQLLQAAAGYNLNFEDLTPDDKLDLLSIESQIVALTQELNLIFESIARAQVKFADGDENETFAVRLDAISTDISWNMLDSQSLLLAKLAIRGAQYTWISRNDGSMNNNLTVADLQALDASPNAVFPEMLVKHEAPGNHEPSFMQVDWSALPAVGGISIIETFDLQLHPLRLQIERSTGRRIMRYIFSGSDSAPVRPEILESEPPTPTTTRPARSSMDASTPNAPVSRRPPAIPRSSSFSNLKTGATSQIGPRKLRKTPSSDYLVSRAELARKQEGRTLNKAVDAEVEEMRSRASHNRTFLNVQVSSLTCVLSYKRDTPLTLKTVPDLDNFKFKIPQFNYQNQIWSFEEAVNAMKRDMYREIWRQRGALIRELALKAKFITPRKFLSATPTEAAESAASSSTSLVGEVSKRRRWPHVFHNRSKSPSLSRSSTPQSITPQPRVEVNQAVQIILAEQGQPLVTSPTSDSPSSPTATDESASSPSRKDTGNTSLHPSEASSSPGRRTHSISGNS